MLDACCESDACAVTATAVHKTTPRILVRSFMLREIISEVSRLTAYLNRSGPL